MMSGGFHVSHFAAMAAFAACVSVALAALAQQSRRVDDATLKNAGKTGDEWLTYGLNQSESRYSPLNQINTGNVNRLGLTWSLEIGAGGGNQEATPLVSNGVLNRRYVLVWRQRHD